MAPVPDRGAFSLSMADVPDSPEYEKLKTFEKQIRWMSPDLKPRNNSLDGPSELPDLELAFPKASTLRFWFSDQNSLKSFAFFADYTKWL